MIARILLSVVCLAIPYVALSAPVSVRSGEHGEFTRLVLQITPDVIWRGVSDGKQFSIILPDHKDGFDTSSVFQRINRLRIAKVTGDQSELKIELNCECEVDTFRVGTGLLVLDVSGQASPPQDATSRQAELLPRFEQRLSFGEMVAVDLNVNRKSSGIIQKEPEVALPVATSSEFPDSWLSLDASAKRDSKESPVLSAAVPEEADTQASLKEARDRLAAQFGMASTRGLLQPEEAMRTLGMSSKDPQIDTSVFDSSADFVVEEEVKSRTSNVRISSSLDIDQRPVENRLSETLGLQCIDPKRLAISDWALSGDFQKEVGVRISRKLGSDFA